MSKIIKKSFNVYDFDKFENWLNQMADEGFTLSSVEHCGFPVFNNKKAKFHFAKTEDEKYTFRVLLLNEHHKFYDAHKQTSFVTGTGAEFVCYYNYYAIFKQKSELGEFNLYSDKTAKINYLSKLLKTFIFLSILCLVLGVFTILNFLIPPVHSAVALDIAFFTLFYLFFEVYNIIGIVKTSKKLKKLKQEALLFE